MFATYLRDVWGKFILNPLWASFLVGVGFQGIKWPQNITPPPLPIPPIPSSSDFHFLMMRSFKIVYGHIILKEGLKDILWPRCIELPLGFFLIGKGVQDILCIHVYMVVKYWTFYTIWFSFLLEKVFGILYNHKTILFDLKWGSPLKFLILR